MSTTRINDAKGVDARIASRADASRADVYPSPEALDQERVLRSVIEDVFGVEGDPVEVGRFELLRRIGSGATGQVHEARDPSLDRPVALKLLYADVARRSGQEGGALWGRVEALARLSHPNIVRVHEIGVNGGPVFIVMELVAGKNLREWIDEDRPGWREILGVLRRAGEGLAAAHDVGIVHRDFKPEDVLLGRRAATADGIAVATATTTAGAAATEATSPGIATTATAAPPRLGNGVVGRVCVADFGLARAIPEPTPPSTEPTPHDGPDLDRGTRAFRSPERAPTPRSDQFSFCATLYWALFGGYPYPRGADGGPRTQGAEGPLAPADAHGVPLAVRQAIARGLAPDPARRHPGMRALLAALDLDERPPTEDRGKS